MLTVNGLIVDRLGWRLDSIMDQGGALEGIELSLVAGVELHDRIRMAL